MMTIEGFLRKSPAENGNARNTRFSCSSLTPNVMALETLHCALPILRFSLVFRTSEMGFCYSPESNGTRDQPEDADNHFIQMPTEALRGKKSHTKKRQAEQYQSYRYYQFHRIVAHFSFL